MPKLADQSPLSERKQANKAEVAEWFGVSVATVDAWLRRGAPYVQKGGPGKGWVFDLREVAQWYYGKSAQDTEDDPEKLDPKSRLDWYRGSSERDKWLERRGELVTVSDYERELSVALKRVAIMLETLADTVERETGLPGASVEVIQRVTDQMREDIYQRLVDDAA